MSNRNEIQRTLDQIWQDFIAAYERLDSCAPDRVIAAYLGEAIARTNREVK